MRRENQMLSLVLLVTVMMGQHVTAVVMLIGQVVEAIPNYL
jgi:hypothetical protein